MPLTAMLNDVKRAVNVKRAVRTVGRCCGGGGVKQEDLRCSCAYVLEGRVCDCLRVAPLIDEGSDASGRHGEGQACEYESSVSTLRTRLVGGVGRGAS